MTKKFEPAPRVTQNTVIQTGNRRNPRRVVLSVHLDEKGDRMTRTKQEFLQEVNINELWARAKRGISPPSWMTNKTPMYGDFSELPVSFDQAFAQVEAANAAFQSLPIEFRRALDHDPRNLDKAPRSLYEEFGLLKPTPSKAPGGATGLPVEAPAAQPSADPKNPPNKPTGSKKGTPPVDPASD